VPFVICSDTIQQSHDADMTSLYHCCATCLLCGMHVNDGDWSCDDQFCWTFWQNRKICCGNEI